MSKNLKYYQQILAKVSFDGILFRKELKKAYGYLNPKDQMKLSIWVNDFIVNRADLQSAVLAL